MSESGLVGERGREGECVRGWGCVCECGGERERVREILRKIKINKANR